MLKKEKPLKMPFDPDTMVNLKPLFPSIYRKYLIIYISFHCHVLLHLYQHYHIYQLYHISFKIRLEQKHQHQ